MVGDIDLTWAVKIDSAMPGHRTSRPGMRCDLGAVSCGIPDQATMLSYLKI